MVGSIFFGLLICFLKAIFLKMVNDVVRVPSVNLLDKLAKINYLYTHTHTSIYLFIFHFFGGQEEAGKAL